MRDHDGLNFPVEEYRRRVEAVRKRMARRNIQIVVITDPENLFYLTGHQTTGYSYFQALVVPLEGEPLFICRLLEESNIKPRTWVEITRPYTDTADAIGTLWYALNEFGFHDKVIGYERNSYFFPAYQQERMVTAFPHGDFVDCYGIVEESRIVKSEYEIDFMRRAARAGQAGMAAGLDAVRPGVTEDEVAAETTRAMYQAGGEYPAVVPYITSGPRCLLGHATWEGRRIQSNECVHMEVGGCYRRYHAAMMRTAWTGKPPKVMREAEALGLEALQAMRETIRAGVTSGEVDRVAREIITDNDFGAWLITRAGYSIGVAFAPSWDEGYILSLKPADSTPLETNMTLHLIPWLWEVDGDKILGISDTIRVTEDGCESFFDAPEKLHVAPG